MAAHIGTQILPRRAEYITQASPGAHELDDVQGRAVSGFHTGGTGGGGGGGGNAPVQTTGTNEPSSTTP